MHPVNRQTELSMGYLLNFPVIFMTLAGLWYVIDDSHSNAVLKECRAVLSEIVTA